MLVLGVVRMFQPIHGYTVHRELVSWRAPEWASIKSGSIYNALKTLTADGALEVVETEQIGSRPERTTYRITPQGTEELNELLRDTWWTLQSPGDPLMAAVSLMGFVTRKEILAAIEHRIVQLDALVRSVRFKATQLDPRETPDHVHAMLELGILRAQAEAAWCGWFAEQVRAGKYVSADDPDWQPASAKPEFHKLPPKLTAGAKAATARRVPKRVVKHVVKRVAKRAAKRG
jgi:DNA-binding PadR family transcriptional regulator